MAPRKVIRLGGRKLTVATKLAASTNAKRGYCQTCSGNGTTGKTKTGKARTCRSCNGTGRATKPATKTTAGLAPAKPTSQARTSAQTLATRRPGPAAGGARTAYGTAAAKRTAARRTKKSTKKRTALRLVGIGGKRLPVNRAVRGWIRGTFATRTTTTARARAGAGAGRSFGQVIALGDNPGAAWWRCPACGTGETGLRDGDTATGRAATHWFATHPAAPFRIEPR